jgi:uncharacterized Ntn-hydrolase superfamily protein
MTYSIVAHDPNGGDVGVAVQSHYFGAGWVVPWLEAGVGAVATQAMAEMAHGPNGLRGLREGGRPADVLQRLVDADDGSATRQVAIVSAAGQVAVHTGKSCIAHAGHVTGAGWAVQANMMREPGVPEAMAEAFTGSDGPLAHRMLAALEAAEAAGGDVRGRQSAGLFVAPAEGNPWDRSTSLRVDDHPDPLVELRRLVEMHDCYARGEHGPAMGTNPEMRFWTAVGKAGDGDVDGARAELEAVYAADEGWRRLVERLPAAGLLPDEPGLVDRLTT